jgi:1-acyl-sn-glycerol-3-phosphate acyltransferase
MGNGSSQFRNSPKKDTANIIAICFRYFISGCKDIKFSLWNDIGLWQLQKNPCHMPLIDIKELETISPVFRGKAGNALAEALMRILKVKEANELYDRHPETFGPDFAADILKDIGVSPELYFEDNKVKSLDEIIPVGPFITISNHPCGHIDGIALIDLFGHIRPEYKVMVNEMLARIHNLNGSFIKVTPTGNTKSAATASSLGGVREALQHLKNGNPIGFFPSGAVSDFTLKTMKTEDRQWQEPLIRMIRKARVPIIPVRFYDGNSPFYYSLGLIDWRVRLLRLPSEVFNKKDKPFRIGIGKPIPVSRQDEFGNDLRAFSNFLRASVYDMFVTFADS